MDRTAPPWATPSVVWPQTPFLDAQAKVFIPYSINFLYLLNSSLISSEQ